MFNPGEHIGTFKLDRRLTRSGFGEVWDAEHSRLRVRRFLTLITDPDFARLFRTSRPPVCRIDHVRIVKILESNSGNDPPYYVVPHLHLEYLRNILDVQRTLPMVKAVDVAMQLLEILDFSHSHGVVHGNILPDHILMSDSGEVKLSGFGFSHVYEQAVAANALKIQTSPNLPNAVLGLLAYMAPERLKGTTTNIQSDIFSVGVLLQEMLTGKLLSEDPMTLMEDLLLPPPLINLIIRSLSAANRRFLNAAEFHRALKEIKVKHLAKVQEPEKIAVQTLNAAMKKSQPPEKSKTEPLAQGIANYRRDAINQERHGKLEDALLIWKQILGIYPADEQAQICITRITRKLDATAAGSRSKRSAEPGGSPVESGGDAEPDYSLTPDRRGFLPQSVIQGGIIVAILLIVSVIAFVLSRQPGTPVEPESSPVPPTATQAVFLTPTITPVPTFPPDPTATPTHIPFPTPTTAPSPTPPPRPTAAPRPRRIVHPTATPHRAVPKSPHGFVYVNPGSFIMGSRSDVESSPGDQAHRVTIQRPFFLAKREVSQAEWMNVMSTNPSLKIGYNLPVQNVSWYEAVVFCNHLSQHHQLEPVYYLDADMTLAIMERPFGARADIYWDADASGYRLPTEAEWEFACRAGSQTAYSWGSGWDCHRAMAENDSTTLENQCTGTYRILGLAENSPAPPASFPANPWGLFDMHGNVAEWCWDWKGPYSAEPVIDPRGPVNGNLRAVRGGSWTHRSWSCRAAIRQWEPPYFKSSWTGFRLARNAPEVP